MSRRIALIVGVSQYDKSRTGLDSLAAPVNDAQAVYDVLHQYGGFDTLYPLPLGIEGVDASGFVPSGELVERLAELLNPQAGDEVELAVIYFSGHGVSERGQVVYLSASDERLAVAVPWLADLAKSSAVKNVCLWLDCCHSGEVLKFADLGDKGFCVVAASHADGEALALDGRSLLTELLCKALTPGGDNGQEIRVLDFVQAIEAGRKNLPQQVLCRWGDTPFTLTQFHGETTVTSAYPPDYPPYKGLLTFTQADREFFFGRDGMIQQLLDKLSASHFVPLLGASGSGKSSLVLAGLLPKLPESDWQVLVMRPTAQPLQNLRDTLVRGFPDVQVGTLASGVDLQREVLRLVTAGKRLLLVIDQFEEVFTECRDDAARADFFACLLEALESDNPLHLVLTLRADFLGHCTEQAYSGLGQRLQHHSLLLVAPTAGELREAITRPLVLVGMRCEQALEDELVDQTLHAKGSLPLLQYVLEKLWQSARQERSRELTLVMYQQLGGQHGGGLRGVLNEKADAFYQQLEPQQQRLMEWLMVELTQVGDGQDDTRRTVTLQELHNRQPQYTEALDALLAQLVTHERLLTQDHDDHGQATITVAHEALIRDWQRLRGWLESNREIKSWRLRLEDSITSWKNGVSGSLLREKRLAESQQILDKYYDSFLIGQDERQFVAASQSETKRRKRLQTGILLAFITVLLAGISATTWQWQRTEQQRQIATRQKQEADLQRQIAIQQKQEAEQQRQIATQKKQEAEQQTNIALVSKLASQAELAVRTPTPSGWLNQGLLLGVQAYRLDPVSPVALSALKSGAYSTGHLHHSLYISSPPSVTAFSHSQDGKFIISGGDDNTLRLWNIASGQAIGIPWQGHESYVSSVTFSPDGKFVVSGSDDNTLRLWDVAKGQSVGTPWQGHENNVSTVAFSPDGKFVISGSWDNTLRLWDASKGQSIGASWQGHGDSVTTVAFSPDGKFVVSGSNDSTLRLWDVASGQPAGMPWQGHKGTVNAVAFSPDGKLVVSGSDDNTLRLWDVAKGQSIDTPWQGHESTVNAVAFSPDGKLVISGSGDNTLRLWDVASRQAVGTPWQGHENYVSFVTFSPDGKFVVSGSHDNTLRLWDVAKGQSIDTPWQGHESTVNAIAFSPDGKLVVSGSGDNTLHLWNIASGQAIGIPWRGHDDVTAIAFSPSGKFVVSSSLDSTLRLWDVASGQPAGVPWQGHEYIVNAVAFSPDGKFVVSGSQDISLRLWDVTNGKSVGRPWQGHKFGVLSVAFSPDGKLVVSGSEDKTLRLWDVAKGQSVGTPWQGHGSYVSSVAFSPDGKFVVSGSWDNSLRLWDVASGQAIDTPWQGHESYVSSVAFSPDGKFVVSGSWDNTLRLWNVASGQAVGTPWRGHEKSVKAVAFTPDGRYVASGSSDGTLRLWDADPESWAKKACSIVNRNFSLAEWQRFIGDALPYQKTCTDLPAPGEKGWIEPYTGE